jgi:signal transduction histidine kinase
VSAGPAPGGTVVAVADTGSGIAPDHLPRIFERFYRADPGRSREEGGSGLGLAIVKHLVEAHGGRVEARSSLGRGTTIRMFLPEADLGS